MATAWIPLAAAGAQAVGSWLAGKRQSAQAMQMNKKTYKYNRKLNKQTADLDFDNAVKLMRKESAYQEKYLSNSSLATEKLNKNLMDYQYGLERQSRQNAYGDTRIDLENAGYNPLLAVGQQSGYTSVGSGVGTQSEGMENGQLANSAMDIMEKFSNMRNAARGMDLNEATLWQNSLNSKYNNDLTSAKAEHERSMTRGQDISNGVDDVYKLLQASATLDLTEKQTEQLDNLIYTTIKRLDNETREADSRIGVNSAKSAEAYASAENQRQQAKYNKERHRGYQTSNTQTRGDNFSVKVGPFSVSGGRNYTDGFSRPTNYPY